VETEYDLIVCATGFRSLDFMHPIQITGSAGRSLTDIWSSGAKAMYAMVVESLPNFAMLYGPNGSIAHSSIILMTEAQSRYINALIK
jgi:cation diffusion facilitator CzcD-associated flavoprotein CzcO